MQALRIFSLGLNNIFQFFFFTVCHIFVHFQITYLPTGIIVSVEITYVLIIIQCKCVKRRKTRVIGRWKCPHPVVQIRCLNHRTWERTLISYKLVKKTCVRVVKRRRIPVLCKFSVSIYKPCRSVPYGWARSIIRRYYLRRNCKCVPRIKYTRIICRCWRPRVRRECNRRTGVLSIFYERFIPARSRRRCRRIVRLVRRTIRCAPRWVLVERLPCFLLRKRTVRVGCRCRIEFQKIPVRIKCAKDSIIRGRCNERVCRRRIKHITFQPRRCRCVRRVFYHNEKCYDGKCPRPRIINRKCIGGIKIGLLIFYKKIRCRCRKFKRILRKRPSTLLNIFFMIFETLRDLIVFIPECFHVHKYAIGPCQNGYQLFVVVRYYHRKCRCIPVRRTFKKFCCKYEL